MSGRSLTAVTASVGAIGAVPLVLTLWIGSVNLLLGGGFDIAGQLGQMAPWAALALALILPTALIVYALLRDAHTFYPARATIRIFGWIAVAAFPIGGLGHVVADMLSRPDTEEP